MADPAFKAKSKFNQDEDREDLDSVISHLENTNPEATGFMASAIKFIPILR
jgi:hypothetical protein